MLAPMPAKYPSAIQGITRPLWAISAAILLPLIIYLLISTGIGYRSQREAVEQTTLRRATEISNYVDGRLNGVSAMMRVLATIRSIREEDWEEARSRSREIAALDPDWRNVVLVDLDRGIQLYALTTPLFEQPVAVDVLRQVARNAVGRPIFGGVRRNRQGQYQINAYLAVAGAKGRRLLLIVGVSPEMIQRILLARAPKDGVSGVVDRSGAFIARTIAFEQRVGTPATHFVRDAVKGGPSGIYRGVTWEGLESYTGFMTSPATGWSAHVAVSSRMVDSPERWWLLSSGLAGLVSIGLGLVLAWFAIRMVGKERTAEDRVHQAERLETAGKLIGGVAHDFNNMLAIIMGSLDLAQRRHARGETDIARYLDNAMDGAQRAADLTRRLLAFSRRQALTPVPVDTNGVITGMRDLLARTLSEDIALDFQLAPALHTVLVDPTLLENAIVNLAINARDAMPGGGRLLIETRNVALRGREAPFPPASGDYACISVRDTGTGMTADVLAKVFEPFFTTKPAGKGTGLGLAQVHGFVSQSGGVIDVQSTPGEGTVFHLYLPGHDRPAVSPVKISATATPRGGGETILLVEDEERLRRTEAEALRELGYEVLEAAGGAEALVLLDREPAIRLLLTDVVMPGMSGIDLARRAKEERPELKVLYMTGFERDAADGNLLGSLLRKPFGVEALARRVRWALDESRL